MHFFAEPKIALYEDQAYTFSFPQKNLSWHFMGHKIFYSLSNKHCTTTDFHQIKYLHLEIGFVFSIWKSFHLRNSERMSGEESAIFYTNLAHFSHFRQNHSTLSHLSTKITLKKVISTEVKDIWDITLLVSRSEYPRDKPFLLTMVHILKNK